MQLAEALKQEGMVDYILHTTTPPDNDGYMSLGLNCDIPGQVLDFFRHQDRVKIIIEINSYVPWVYGHPDYGNNRIHLSEAFCVYENHDL